MLFVRIFAYKCSLYIDRANDIYKVGGSQIFGRMYARGGGGHSDAYCVQQGGWGGLKIGKNCVCN